MTLQRQLGPTRVAELAYVGSRGRNLIAARDINQPGRAQRSSNLRPDPRFADITLIESRARSEFDSLQARFQQRYAFGCTMLVAYTLGKSMDDASGFFTSAGDPNFPQDSANPGAEWGRSSFDVRHRFSVSFSYDLPFDFTDQRHRRRCRAAGRSPWRCCPKSTTATPAARHSASAPTIGRMSAAIPSVGDPGPNQWFNTAAFSMPAFGTFGNAGRNILEGPGYQNVNLAVLKQRARCAGSTRLQLRAEAFNLFNRANFDLPDNFFGSPTFGQICRRARHGTFSSAQDSSSRAFLD